MIEIVAHPQAPHQQAAAAAFAEGLRKHGEVARVLNHVSAARADIVICWGWRNGKAIKRACPDTRVLIMERGYVGDRKHWTSLGWDGLNGRARFPVIDDGGGRWRQHFPDALQPMRSGGDYALLLGQVRGDASLESAGSNFAGWYAAAANLIRPRSNGLPLLFRPHPQEIERYGLPAAGQGFSLAVGSLDEALAGAASAWAHSSNSLVDAALAGVPVHAFDHGAMVWPIAGTYLQPGLRADQRERWAHALAWCQWSVDEMRSGVAWEAVQHAMSADVPAWSSADRWGWRDAA